MAELEEQLAAMREMLTSQLDARDGDAAAAAALGPASTSAAAAALPVVTASAETQTDDDGLSRDSERLLAMERWQHQMSAVSEWLRTGAALLNAPDGNPMWQPPEALGPPPGPP